jgi:hypothetical protein
LLQVGKSFRICWFLIALSLLAGAGLPTPARAQDVAYVLDVQGRWYVTQRPEKDLRKGHALRAGESVSPRPGFRISDSIVILKTGGQMLANRQCSRRGDCERPIRISGTPPATESATARLVQAVMSLWESDGPKFTALISRGATARLAEGVVKLADGRADLSSVLELSGGTYTLVWTPVSGSDAEKDAGQRSLSFTWDPAHPVSIPAPDLRPGLYDVSAYSGASPSPDADVVADAWILVADAASYPQLGSRFAAAQSLTRQWTPEPRKGTIRSFLRASLFDLASSRAPGQG